MDVLLDRRSASLAAGQYGLITRFQALALGLTSRMIEYRLKTGRWVLVHPGVYAIAGSSANWRQAQLAACFWCKGVTAGQAAARVWDLRGWRRRGPEVLIKGSKTVPRAGIVVHHSTVVPSHHVTIIEAIPVTTVERTLFMLAGMIHETDAAIALDDALRRKLTTLPSLDRYLRELSGRGRNGTGVMRRLLEPRRQLGKAPESPLETEFLQLIVRSGLPLPVPQFEVRHRGEFVARVDFAYPDAKVAIELDSYAFHSDRSSWERDRSRLSGLTSIGWRVEGITKAKLRDYPDRTIRRLDALGAFTISP
jgi:hypothetical protein